MIKKVNKNIFKNQLNYSYILFVPKLLTFIDSGCYGHEIKGTIQNNSITNNTRRFPNETDIISTGMQNKYEDFATAYLTTKFSYSTTQANRGYYAYSQPALIKGRVPKWGAKVGRQPPDPGDIRTPTTFTRPTTPFNYNLPPATAPGQHRPPAGHDAPRFTYPPSTTKKKFQRTNKPRVSLMEDCDYNAYYCLKAFDTGQVCGKTMYMTHFTFKNYCMLEFVNCMERAEVWIPVYMGECFLMSPLTEFKEYKYSEGRWMYEYIVADDL